MRKLGIILFVATLTTSCGGAEKENQKIKNEKEKIAPYKVKYSDEINALLNKADAADFPYTVDTTLLDTVRKYDSLGGKEVEWLYANVNKNALNESVSYDVEQFFVIDSIKRSGTYAEWADQLDIGNMKYANAYLLHKIHMSDTCDIITWAVTYETVQACPYAAGEVIFATFFYNGTASGCNVIGESMGAGDAPVSMSRRVMSQMNKDGKISLHLKEVNSESGDEGETNEVEEEDFTIKINSGKIQFLVEPPAKGKKK